MAKAPAVLQLNVAPDHVESLTKFKNPVLGIEELLWNAFDADATEIAVEFKINLIGALDTIIVRDNGCGIDPSAKQESFGKLGGSAKRRLARTPGGRAVHGKEGKGRFRAFRLGARIEWDSRFTTKTGLVRWTVSGDATDLTRFRFGEPRPARGGPGTTVTISNVDVSPTALRSESARADLVQRLALYLRSYPKVSVRYDGSLLDLAAIVEKDVSYDVQADDC